MTGTRLVGWATTPHRLRGMALCRILLGLAGVDFYVSSMAQRDLLSGPDGYLDLRMFRAEPAVAHIHSLYGLSASTVVFQLLFFTGLAVAAAFTVFGGRPLTVLHAVFLWSLYQRNGQILDGGDNLASILVILLVFVVTDAHYSPLADRRRGRLGERARQGRPSVVVLVHNAAVLLVTFQIAILYFCAGAWKMTGPLWQDGTAMYYVDRTSVFRFLSLGWVTTNALTTTLLSWSAVAANLAFPVSLLTKWHRVVDVAMAMAMHVGIIVVMGLTGFGITMIGTDLGCISDEEYADLGRVVHRLAGRLIGGVARRPTAAPTTEGPTCPLPSPTSASTHWSAPPVRSDPSPSHPCTVPSASGGS